ncbi:dihydroorotate dehydrogenase electron transfer subunit [Nocardioides currus]|uniref:Dihydroorotate dehydrogenase electron transfer subunit n=1 Tax=Nocardioides currus TaxID=2133958 RepID=A0A2R7YTL2_9ACTN|nr:dihydroorotate dehydrogenase electron transfer subunit [Nocardioides currus]
MLGPLHVTGEVLATKKSGAYRHLTITAPGIPQRFRAGNFVAVSVDGGRLARRPLWIHRVKESGAFGPTLDVVVGVAGPGTAWLAERPVGSRLEVTGPLGRPFALPREPVACVLVGVGHGAAPLFPLAERLRERGCAVTLVVAAPDEARLLSALEARRSARAVTVITGDGSVGVRGDVRTEIAGVLDRADADVVYAVGPHDTLRAVAAEAEARGAWSQVALEVPMPCGTGLCQGCPVPVVAEDGATRLVRACADGPVIRGDRVHWEALS